MSVLAFAKCVCRAFFARAAVLEVALMPVPRKVCAHTSVVMPLVLAHRRKSMAGFASRNEVAVSWG